jgi:hypothetical protein
MYNC